MPKLLDKINDQTGFANGDKFETPEDVKDYFTVNSMIILFGPDHGLTQEHLDIMAEEVIKNRWHMKSSKTFSVRINYDESKGSIEQKLKDLQNKISEYNSNC